MSHSHRNRPQTCNRESRGRSHFFKLRYSSFTHCQYKPNTTCKKLCIDPLIFSLSKYILYVHCVSIFRWYTPEQNDAWNWSCVAWSACVRYLGGPCFHNNWGLRILKSLVPSFNEYNFLQNVEIKSFFKEFKVVMMEIFYNNKYQKPMWKQCDTIHLIQSVIKYFHLVHLTS